VETVDIMLRIEEMRPTASEAQSNIVEYVLAHPDEVAGKSIHELADATFTSPSTIVRFCRELGCAGYKDFQRSLIYVLAVNQRSKDTAFSEIKPTDTTDEIMRKVTRKNVTSLENTGRLLNPKAIDQVVDMMGTCRTVNLFGVGASLLVAKDFQLKLLRVSRPCNLCDDWNSQLLYAKNMVPEDLAVVISYSGLTKEMVCCAKVARGRGSKVVAITRGGFSSPLVVESDIVLDVAATELLVRSGASSSRISQLNVVDILYATYVSRNYESCTKGFMRNYINKEKSEY
jgi:DNA-binding MurR/RpiR family transcriptional regulator